MVTHSGEEWCFTPSSGGPSGIYLLQACRQIYSEAAHIPLQQNTFSFWWSADVKGCLKEFRKAGYTYISSVQLQVAVKDSSGLKRLYALLFKHMCKKLQGNYLAGLKELVLRLRCPLPFHSIVKRSLVKKLVRKALKETLPEMRIKARVRLMKIG